MRVLSQADEHYASVAWLPMPSEMLRHLGRVARQRREEADVMLAEVAARFRALTSVKKTEGAFSRFERGETQPTYLDQVIDAYAAELDVEPFEIWQAAVEAWRATPSERTTKAAGRAMERLGQEAAQRDEGRQDTARDSGGARRKRGAA
jgi:transcriptional regulator with XRE-family HTH domain